MCDTCGWRGVVEAIEAHLDQRPIDHAGLILAKAADVVDANRCVSADLRDLVQSVIDEWNRRLA